MKVLVLGAGGPAGVNTCRALYAGGHDVWAWDDQRDHLIWTDEWASRQASLSHVSDLDLVMPQPDAVVMSTSDTRTLWPETFLPSPQTIALCQDKFECGLAWRRAGLREDRILLAGELLRRGSYPAWIRARWGAGGRSAIRATDVHEAGYWLEFWLGRDHETDFVIEDFLPGRDYSWCGVYADGKLWASFARERLEYLYPQWSVEGITGTPTRAVITEDPNVTVMAQAAVEAVDDFPHGIFCVDLREDEDGTPRPTEINAGRFSTTVGLWSIYKSTSNFVALAAELGVGDYSRLDDWIDLPEGLTLSRHIDCGHVFTQAKVLV